MGKCEIGGVSFFNQLDIYNEKILNIYTLIVEDYRKNAPEGANFNQDIRLLWNTIVFDFYKKEEKISKNSFYKMEDLC